MSLELGTFDVMSYLWDTMEKTEDGNHIIYTEADVETLWQMGFVDTERFPLPAWRTAFDAYVQPDGSFLLSKDAFLSLDTYRYRGEIRVPLDAMMINEGKYTDEGLKELFSSSVAPSVDLPTDEVHRFFEQLTRDFRDERGLIIIGPEAKRRIAMLLEDYPSPLRNLEILFDRMMTGVEGEEAGTLAQEASRVDQERNLTRGTSAFHTAAANVSESSARELQKMTKAKAKTSLSDDAAPSTPLKKIRRSPKGTRG